LNRFAAFSPNLANIANIASFASCHLEIKNPAQALVEN
jgi:hypothetical protein